MKGKALIDPNPMDLADLKINFCIVLMVKIPYGLRVTILVDFGYSFYPRSNYDVKFLGNRVMV